MYYPSCLDFLPLLNSGALEQVQYNTNLLIFMDVQFKKSGFFTRNFKLLISRKSSVDFPSCLDFLPLLNSGALGQVGYALPILQGSQL